MEEMKYVYYRDARSGEERPLWMTQEDAHALAVAILEVFGSSAVSKPEKPAEKAKKTK